MQYWWLKHHSSEIVGWIAASGETTSTAFFVRTTCTAHIVLRTETTRKQSAAPTEKVFPVVFSLPSRSSTASAAAYFENIHREASCTLAWDHTYCTDCKTTSSVTSLCFSSKNWIRGWALSTWSTLFLSHCLREARNCLQIISALE